MAISAIHLLDFRVISTAIRPAIPGDPLRSAPDSVSDGISESLGATIRVDVGTQLQVARTARNMFFRENPWWVKRLQHMSPQTSTESKMLKVKPIETAIQIDSRKGNISQKSSVVVEVRNLSKSYGHQLAVKDVSFSFHGGAVLGLLGPNGAGKSTVMMMITGLLAPTSGDVIVNGEKYDGRHLQ